MPTNGIPGRARTLAALLALGVAAALAPTPVTAQGKAPTGPIEITVGSSPGGTPDVIMRNVVKIMTEDGIVGWSEYDEGFGAPGVTAAIERLAARVVGKNAYQHERIYAELFSATRPAAGGASWRRWAKVSAASWCIPGMMCR